MLNRLQPEEEDAMMSELLSHIHGLYAYARALTRNEEDAKDLVQDTYLRAIGARAALRPDSDIRAWLFKIQRNTWLNRRRSSGTMILAGDAELDRIHHDRCGGTGGGDQNPYRLMAQRADRDAVQRAIRFLPGRDREIVLLREYEELSYEQIAGILQCPMGTVMSRLARARARLRVILRSRHEAGLRAG